MQLIGWYFDMEATNIYSPGGRPSGYLADWMLLTTNRAFLKKSLIGYTRASVRQADSYLD
ncbi:MAG: hypothetical protein VYA48_09765 [Gemmatimonadota bacterium]|nr:hypothetical protein [Gemmatimonadota bacterium]